MLDLLVQNVISNKLKLDAAIKYFNKKNIIIGTGMMLTSVAILGLVKIVMAEDARIDNLEEELEMIKSKGE